MATMMARMAETLRYGVGHEFRRQVMVLFLQSPLSSCVVSKSLYKLHQLAITDCYSYLHM